MNKNHSLGINAFLNVIQQLCSVLFPLITIPYVARVLETENYGKVNFTSSIISYFILLAQLGVATYGVREVSNTRGDKEKCNLVISEIFSITVVSSIVSYLVLLFIVLCIPKLRDYYILFLVQSISIAFYTMGAEWINKAYEDYVFLTIRYIITQITSIVLMFIFVKTKSDYVIYALITVIAQAGAYILNFIHIKKYADIRITKQLNLSRHLRPLLILFFNGLATTIYVNSDSTLLGLMQDNSAVGIYNISAKIYIIVKHVINAIVLVSIPRLSQMKANNDHKEYNNLVNRIFGVVIVIVFPAMFGLAMLSYSIIYVFSGTSYLDGVLPLRILSVSLLFAVVGCYLVNCVLVPLKKDKTILFASTISAIVNFVLNLYFIPQLSFVGAAITTLIAEIIMVTICCFSVNKLVKIKPSKNTIVATLLSCLAVIGICSLSAHVINNEILRIVFSVFLSGWVYLIILKVTNNELIEYIAFHFKKKRL